MKKSELFKLNDNELIFLMRQGSEEANKLLHQKYNYLIKSKAKQFKSEEYKNVDFIQEGQIALNKAVSTYDFTKDKSFNRYYELLLDRRFISLIRKSKTMSKRELKKQEMEEEKTLYIQEVENDLNLVSDELSELEKKIYTVRMVERKSVSNIVEMMNIEPKQVYNAVARVKRKIRKAKE